MIIIVTGSRRYTENVLEMDDLIRRNLALIHRENSISVVRHGDAPHSTGADQLAAAWARSMGIATDPMPANWYEFGRRAGTIRNLEMIVKEPRADLIVGFPGGSGTAHCMFEGNRAGIMVLDYTKEKA